jgi:hypothetical protein
MRPTPSDSTPYPIRRKMLLFYIAHYRSSDQTVKLLNLCLKGIRTQYPDSQIIVCETPSLVPAVGYKLVDNIIWTQNPYPSSSCVGCFREFLNRNTDPDQKAIFLHDSMILKAPFQEERLQHELGFLWSFDTYHTPSDLEHPQLKALLFQYLSEWDLSTTEYLGCFGISLFGTRRAVQRLWDMLPFEEFLQLEPRRQVMLDLERVVGAAAFATGLVAKNSQVSLCGEIFDFPRAFQSWYAGESYEELLHFPYREACLKVWGGRFTHPPPSS